MELRKVRLGEIASFVTDKVRSDNITLAEYVTTDSLLQNKAGRTVAQNLPPQPCSLTRYKSGDVLIGNIRPYLKKIWLADGGGGCSNDVLVFRAKEGFSSSFLYAILSQDTFFDYLMLAAKGSKMPRGDKDHAMRFKVPFFPIEQQRRIGKLLSDIDRKIALNRRMNATLEAMARQLYDYWFLQFDFPDAHGKPYKSSGGKMTWNNQLKRDIPEGWSVGSVNDIATMTRGVSYTKDDLVDEKTGMLVLRGNNIQNNHLEYDNNVAYIPKTFISDEQRIRRYDIIMTMSSGSKEHVGKSVMFQRDSNETYGAFLSKFTPNSDFPYLLSQLFNSDYFKAKIKRTAIGTGINNLTNQTFDEILTIIPPKQLLVRFNRMQKAMYDEMGNQQDNSLHLTRLRTTLLPLLMNGQVSVEEPQ